jgi:hypothetical protein
MKNVAPFFLILLTSTAAISQTIQNFAAKCDQNSGYYLTLVSESNSINLLEKPTKSGPFPWKGVLATGDANKYTFTVLSGGGSKMECSLERKSGRLKCNDQIYQCDVADYQSTLSLYRSLQGQKDKENNEREIQRKKEADAMNARPNKF